LLTRATYFILRHLILSHLVYLTFNKNLIAFKKRLIVRQEWKIDYKRAADEMSEVDKSVDEMSEEKISVD